MICDVDSLIPVVNENSRFKVGTLWKVIIKYVLPVFLIGMWLVGIYDLFTDVNSFEVTLYVVITVLVLVFSGILTKIKSD
jgi:NSS family neurotransmitter:Na+ symporter